MESRGGVEGKLSGVEEGNKGKNKVRVLSLLGGLQWAVRLKVQYSSLVTERV